MMPEPIQPVSTLSDITAGSEGSVSEVDRDKEKTMAFKLKADELLERCGADELDDTETSKHVQLMANELVRNRAVVFDKDPTYIDETLRASYMRAIVEENLVLITQLDALNAQVANLTQTVEKLKATVAQMNGDPEKPQPAPKHAAAPKHASSSHRHAAPPKDA